MFLNNFIGQKTQPFGHNFSSVLVWWLVFLLPRPTFHLFYHAVLPRVVLSCCRQFPLGVPCRVTFCLVLSCLVLLWPCGFMSMLVLPCRGVSCLVLPFLVLLFVCLVLSCPLLVLPYVCLVFSCRFMSCVVLPCRGVSCRVLSSLTKACLVVSSLVSCPVLSTIVDSCLHLSCLAESRFALSSIVLPCRLLSCLV